MSELQLFNFQDNQVRVVEIDGSPWFVAADVFKALDIAWRRSHSLISLSDAMKLKYPGGALVSDLVEILNDTWLISEAGVYKIAFRSSKPEAEVFTNYVAEVILPSVRKTGVHQTLPFKLSSDSSIVMFEDDDYWTTSLIIAELFGKEHYNVLRDLELAQEDILKFKVMSDSLPSFKIIETTYLDKYNRSTKSYKINRSMFNYVVLAYQGDKAKLYRMMFIKAFEELEKKVKVFLTQQMIYSNPKRQQVYVLRNTVSGLIKVGITNDIKRRVAELQNASGCEISVEFLAPKSDNAKDVELTIHKLLDDKRGIGEWFNISSTEAVNILKQQDLVIEPTLRS